MKIYIAGHRGMVGTAILRKLQARKDAGEDLDLVTRSSSELDLTDQAAVSAFMQSERPGNVQRSGSPALRARADSACVTRPSISSASVCASFHT